MVQGSECGQAENTEMSGEPECGKAESTEMPKESECGRNESTSIDQESECFYHFNVYYVKLTGVHMHIFNITNCGWRPAVLFFRRIAQILS